MCSRPGGVDDHDVGVGADRVVGDRGRIAAALAADERAQPARSAQISSCSSAAARNVSAAPSVTVRPDSRSFDGELADRRRLAGAVDADDEDDGGRVRDVERRRLAEQRRDLLGERLAELGQLLPRLEPPDQLGRRAHADVGVDQRLLEPLPRGVVGRVERRDLDLLGQRAPRLAERVAQPAEEPALRLVVSAGRVGVAQELCPASRHEPGR